MNQHARKLNRSLFAVVLVAVATTPGCAGGDPDAEAEATGPQQEPAAGFFTGAPYGGPQVPEEGEERFDDSVILSEIPAPYGKGLIRFIDENPSGEPEISVVEVGDKPVLDLLVPLKPTALEVWLATADASRAPARLVEEHERRGAAPPRELLAGPAEELDDWGPECANVGYSAGFNAWAATVPSGNKQTVFDIQNVSSWSGNFSAYTEIYAAACFKSTADGHNDLGVRMRRNGLTIAGTALTIERHDRYRYFNKTPSCVSLPGRQIVVDDIGFSPSPDVFHVSGAWDDYFACNIQG